MQPPAALDNAKEANTRSAIRAGSEEASFVEVIVATPVAGRFTYRSNQKHLERGAIVAVPFGRRSELGLVVSEPSKVALGDVAAERIRDVEHRFETPPLKAELVDFILWVARYTCSPPGGVLRLVLRSRGAIEPPPLATWYRRAETLPELRLTPSRERVLAIASDGLARHPQALAEEAGVSRAVIKGLIASGVLSGELRRADAPPPKPDLLLNAPKLSAAQEHAASTLKSAVEANAHMTFLLDGVTGSGKTEVYLEAIEAALKAGRQALVLVPEIALTQQFLARFEARFGCPPTLWHSDITSLERRKAWRAATEGTASVVVGARSALFLPFAKLGLIVVDEEHDQSYKQEDVLLYNARDMAIVRARLAGVPVILASATPSLESDVNARAGRYKRLSLPQRHGGAHEPKVATIDLRRTPPERGKFLSPPLVAALRETLERKEQSLLFLNRRGYAPLTICRACGHQLVSPHASTWLVEHRFLNRLVCHQTGFWMPKPDKCPACGTPDSLVACGPGVERIEEEVRALFPEARIEVVSSDLLHGPTAAQQFFEAMRAGEIDILIGTQIVAKGHHFPNLTLVGVVDADLGLTGGDLRAAERTFQLLHQVGGRAGRAERPGRVLLQTYMPEAPVMRALASGERDAFLLEQASEREAAMMPPFGRLASVILSGRAEADTLVFGRKLIEAAPQSDQVRIFGPAVAPIALVRGRHRARLLVKAPRNFNLSAYMSAWLDEMKEPAGLRFQIDIDPYSFL
ncbi:MAG TPA: primosomal protein N' [Alphaproteobacteria bacterium]|nr:primosomal protein N' [Alphaproteobacteria bacterium]